MLQSGHTHQSMHVSTTLITTTYNTHQYNTHYYNIQHTSVTVNIARKSVCVTVWSMIMNHNINFDCKV